MTFAGNFFTEETERQSRYNVIALFQGKVNCSEQDRWQNHGWNEWLHRLSMLYICTNGYFFFCHLSKDTTITPFLETRIRPTY